MDEISGPHGPHQLPAVPVERPTGLVASTVHDAAERLRPHWPGVADWAQRHVWAAVFSSIGSAVGTLLIVDLLVVRGLSSLAEYKETEPISPLPVEVSIAPAADPSLIAPGEQKYTVKRNDTLSDIAEKHEVALSALRERNAVTLEAWRAQCLENAKLQPGACPDVVFKGGKLIIPAPQAVSPE